MLFAEKQLNCNKNLYNKEGKTGKLQCEKTGKKAGKIQSLRRGIGGSKNQGARVINPIRNAPDTI